MIVIKLNPSQELRLRKNIEGVFATPLFCPIVNLSHEEFLSIKKFAIYKMQNADGIYFFPCLLEMPQRKERAAFLCGVSVQQPQGVEGAAGGTQNNKGFRFSLEDSLNKAGGIITAAPETFWSEENFFFNTTSFKMCDMEISGNSWKVYDEVWKKV